MMNDKYKIYTGLIIFVIIATFPFWYNLGKAAPVPDNLTVPAGTILETFPDELCVATGKGVLSIIEIQGPSGKRLSAADFLRGYNLPPGTVLT